MYYNIYIYICIKDAITLVVPAVVIHLNYILPIVQCAESAKFYQQDSQVKLRFLCGEGIRGSRTKSAVHTGPGHRTYTGFCSSTCFFVYIPYVMILRCFRSALQTTCQLAEINGAKTAGGAATTTSPCHIFTLWNYSRPVPAPLLCQWRAQCRKDVSLLVKSSAEVVYVSSVKKCEKKYPGLKGNASHPYYRYRFD